MKIYNLGDRQDNKITPVRISIPEEGINLNYTDSDAKIYVTSSESNDEDTGMPIEGTALFGDPKLHHAELEKELKSKFGVYATSRGVLWKNSMATTVWVTSKVYYLYGLKDAMNSLANGLRKNGINPNNVTLYYPGTFNNISFNVAIRLDELAKLSAQDNGKSCEEFFYEKLQEQERIEKANSTHSNQDEKIVSNGMKEKNVWRHYIEGFRENKQSNKITITESDLQRMINECVRRILNR